MIVITYNMDDGEEVGRSTLEEAITEFDESYVSLKAGDSLKDFVTWLGVKKQELIEKYIQDSVS